MKAQLKELRHNLNLSQESFGKRINLTRGAISLLEAGKRNITERTIIDICREFNVNENWFRYGGNETDMFLNNKNIFLDEYAKQKGITDSQIEIIKMLFDIEPDRKDYVFNAFKVLLSNKFDSDKISAT